MGQSRNEPMLVDLHGAFLNPHRLLLLHAEEGASAARLLRQQCRKLQDHPVWQDSAADSAQPCTTESVHLDQVLLT